LGTPILDRVGLDTKGIGMNNAQLVDAVAERANLTKREARIAVNVVLEEINTAPATSRRTFKPPKRVVRDSATTIKKVPVKKATAKKATGGESGQPSAR